MGTGVSTASPVDTLSNLSDSQVRDKIARLSLEDLSTAIRDGSPLLAAAFEKLGITGASIVKGDKLAKEKDILSPAQVVSDAKRGEISMSLRAQYALATQSAEAALAPLVTRYEKMIEDTEEALRCAEWPWQTEPLQKTIDSLKKLLEDVRPSLDAARATNQQGQLREDAMVALLPQVAKSMSEYDDAQNAILADPEQAAASDEIAKICNEALGGIETSVTSQTLSAEAQALFGGTAGADTKSLECLQALMFDATACKERLDREVALIAVEIEGATAESAPLKGVERAMEKTVQDYAGEFPRLRDLSRCSLKCESTIVARKALEMVIASAAWEIVAIKDRMSRDFNSGQIGGRCQSVYSDPWLHTFLNTPSPEGTVP